MKVKTFYRKNLDSYRKIIKENGGDLDKFLKSYKSSFFKVKYKKLTKNNIKLSENRKSIIKVNVDKKTYIKYRLLCLVENINSKKLLESFLNYFIEGDMDLHIFLDKLNNYNNSTFFRKINMNKSSRSDKILKMIKLQNVDRDWVKKYTNIRIDDIDF